MAIAYDALRVSDIYEQGPGQEEKDEGVRQMLLSIRDVIV
jgi:hypothetical protein